MNKFEQVSNVGHEMSVAGGPSLMSGGRTGQGGSQVLMFGEGGLYSEVKGIMV